ncbi:amidohydrolase family protein [Paraburkholderia ginsengiterrae]|uniref:amidohydrolase family protein n=1 Tax=Paraburkholderia ginsengiterrae TaxID=1462993 RepID=UPI003BF86E4E
MRHGNASTRQVDLKGRTVIPGLNDSHLHIIRGGLNFNMELRWDGAPSQRSSMLKFRPPRMMCRWESFRPGMTVRPLRST